jgi:hypothetical protein
MGNELSFENEYIANGTAPIASRVRHSPNTSARSLVSSAEIDRNLWTGAVLRLSYVHSSTTDMFVVNPIASVDINPTGNPTPVLGLFSSGKEIYSDAEATLQFRPIKDGDLNVSYIWSRSRGDLNTLGDIFIPFEAPVIRPNAYGIRPSDVPNRVVVWGSFRLPYGVVLGPVIDWHTGFPYSKVDELQQYVGVPNTERFSTFFSLDVQVYRDFRIPIVHSSGSRKIRLGFYILNVTNHRNFNQVYNNVTSPFFGEFNGFERQKAAFLLSVVN